jgi:hypothetical protein
VRFLIWLLYLIFLASRWFARLESEDERYCSLIVYLTVICQQWEFCTFSFMLISQGRNSFGSVKKESMFLCYKKVHEVFVEVHKVVM